MTKQRILERNPDLLRDRNEINTISGKVKTRKSKSKKFTQKIEPQDSEYGKMNSIGLLIDSPVGNDGRDDFDNPCSNVPDSRVTVNLAMADLMAYLQVVANNSSNLPMTRRDDPDLGRTVSNLTSDDYAEKCAAFIPSDIRIISGSFTKYGRVWDLPTSDVRTKLFNCATKQRFFLFLTCTHCSRTITLGIYSIRCNTRARYVCPPRFSSNELF